MSKSPTNFTVGINKNQNNSVFSNIDESVNDHDMNDRHNKMADEVQNASKILKQTGKLPISIDSNCLMSMQSGRDAQLVLRLFKTACLSYSASDVSYREHKLTRNQLLGMRKDLIVKVNEYMQSSGLHKEGAIYPRRYFDDLIME